MSETEKKIETAIAVLFQGSADEAGEMVDQLADASSTRVRVQTYEEAGVMTRDAGIVVRVGGAEFQITIVRSR